MTEMQDKHPIIQPANPFQTAERLIDWHGDTIALDVARGYLLGRIAEGDIEGEKRWESVVNSIVELSRL